MFSGMHDNTDPSMPASDNRESATMSTYDYDPWSWLLGYKRLDLQQSTKLCRKTVPAASLSITRHPQKEYWGGTKANKWSTC